MRCELSAVRREGHSNQSESSIHVSRLMIHGLPSHPLSVPNDHQFFRMQHLAATVYYAYIVITAY
jgi:hypothetical protein